jgi:hypothetical protein
LGPDVLGGTESEAGRAMESATGTGLELLLATVPRPFVLITDRELSVLRRGLTKDGWKRSLYLQDAPPDEAFLSGAGLLSRANQWLDAVVDIPERAGDHHGFFCEDGTPLETPSALGGTPSGFICPACKRVYSGEAYSSAYRWFQHRALSSACLALGLIYQIDRDMDCAHKAAEILMKYADRYPESEPEAASGGMMDNWVDEAAWIIPLAQAYDLIYHSKALSPEAKEAVEGVLLRPAAQGLLQAESAGSAASWRLSAAGVIGCAVKDAQLLGEAVDRFAEQVTDELGDDGLWPEPVHASQFSVLSAFVHLAEACSRLGIDLYGHEPVPGKNLKSMFTAPLRLAYPSFQLPAIGDGKYGSTLPLSLYEVANRRWDDPLFKWVLKTGYGFARQPVNEFQRVNRGLYTRTSLYAFLFGRDLPGRVQLPRLQSHVHRDVGVCCLRSGCGTVVTFNCGPAISQGHRDRLGITLFGSDGALVCDYGSVGRGSSVSSYSSSTAAHNTVMVDGQSQQRTSDQELVSFSPGDYLQVAAATTFEANPDVEHKRRVVLADDVIVVQDWLEGDNDHTYDWLLRCEGRLVECPSEVGPTEGASRYFDDVRGLGVHRDSFVRWQADGHGMAASLASDAPAELSAARCPAETAARQVDVIALRRNAGKAEYTAVLVPHGKEAVSIVRQGSAFRITRGQVVDWIHIADCAGDSGAGGSEIQSDALIAAVREVNGSVVACGCVKGSHITLRDEPILAGAGMIERVEARLDSRNPVVAFEAATGNYLRLKCKSRAMRVNGHRISAANLDGTANIRLVGVLVED